MGDGQQKRKTLPSSPLQLKTFWLEGLHIDAEEAWEGPARPTELPLSGRTEIAVSENTENFIVRLNVKTKAVRKPLPYRLNITLGGLFSLPESIPEGTRDQFMRLNGSSILYGIARGLVASLSGIGPNGDLVLPTVDFVRFHRAHRTVSKDGGSPQPDVKADE